MYLDDVLHGSAAALTIKRGAALIRLVGPSGTAAVYETASVHRLATPVNRMPPSGHASGRISLTNHYFTGKKVPKDEPT